MADPAAIVRSFYARLDGDEPGDALALVSGDVAFAMNLPATSFAGGHAELRDYLAGRDVSTGRRHHVREVAVFNRVLTILLESRGPGAEVLGTIVAAVQVDPAGRIERYLVTYSPGMTFSDSNPGI
jgi:hypothetical protein